MAYVDLDKVISVQGGGSTYSSGTPYPINSYSIGIFNREDARNDGVLSYNGWFGLLRSSASAINSDNNYHNGLFSLAIESGNAAISSKVKSNDFSTNIKNVDSGTIRVGVFVGEPSVNSTVNLPDVASYTTLEREVTSNNTDMSVINRTLMWNTAVTTTSPLQCTTTFIDSLTKQRFLRASNVNTGTNANRASARSYSNTYETTEGELFTLGGCMLTTNSALGAMFICTRAGIYETGITGTPGVTGNPITNITEDATTVYFVLTKNTISKRIRMTKATAVCVIDNSSAFIGTAVGLPTVTGNHTLNGFSIGLDGTTGYYGYTTLVNNVTDTPIVVRVNGVDVASQSYIPTHTNLNRIGNIVIPAEIINTANVTVEAYYGNALNLPSKIGIGVTGGDYDTPTGANNLAGTASTEWTPNANSSYLDITLV